MKKIGVFFGSTSGVTTGIVDELEFYLRKDDFETFDVKDGVEKIKDFDNLILVSPTYGVGELQKDWEDNKEELEKIDFTGKKIGILGLGNQFAFGESFVGAMRKLYDIVIKNGGDVVGFTLDEGYSYEETDAVIDGKFVGLAIDEGNQGGDTPERIENWVKQLKENFN